MDFVMDPADGQWYILDDNGIQAVRAVGLTTSRFVYVNDDAALTAASMGWASGAGTSFAMTDPGGGAGWSVQISGPVVNMEPTIGSIPAYCLYRTTYGYKYKFANDGGAAGDIVLTGNALTPGFIVRQAILDVITAPTSGGGATIAVSTGQGAGDLVAATGIAGAPWSTTGIKDTIPVDTAATSIKMTGIRLPKITIATADLIGGEFNLFIEGWVSP